jgi:UDP-N-acetylmuramoylalanine--D-glutamate ligase
VTTFAGRRVLVVGLGITGLATARALLGLEAKVRVLESNDTPDVRERAAGLIRAGAEVELGDHDLAHVDADLAVVSPGIFPSAPIAEALRREGVEIVSDIELAYRVAKCDFIAVTGTNGKTTTTSLLAAMIEAAGLNGIAAGNIGLPVLDAIFMVPEDGVIALEASSFQLAAIHEFQPKVAVVLNIAEDHTDWHGSIDAYAAAKARIVENQTAEEAFVPNLEDERSMAIAEATRARVSAFSALRVPEGRGIGVRDERILFNGEYLMDTADLPLPGRPGVEDCLAAAGAALEYGIDAQAVVRGIKGFRPLGHRLQLVAEAGGVTYIDDSKATNPHATLAAVADLSDVVLIAGGRSKGMDLRPLRATVPPVRHVIALGEASDQVAGAYEGLVEVTQVDSMDQAVRAATIAADGRGSVLLSPACASLDMYESYAARGEEFARAVARILEERNSAGPDERGEGERGES